MSIASVILMSVQPDRGSSCINIIRVTDWMHSRNTKNSIDDQIRLP
jgi:hypothetical protein